MNTKNTKLLETESAELQEAITALAILGNEYEKARKLAQQRVMMANGKVSALIAMLNTPAL